MAGRLYEGAVTALIRSDGAQDDRINGIEHRRKCDPEVFEGRKAPFMLLRRRLQ